MGMIYIGIDPGKHGAYAIIDEGSTAQVWPWDDSEFATKMRGLNHLPHVMACVEKVGAMPGQGVTSMFNFGKSAGFIEGVLSALGIPYQLVTPQRWKKEFTLHNSKQKSVEVCKRLFPDVSLLPTPRCRVASDGMAEALLMAEYARRKM